MRTTWSGQTYTAKTHKEKSDLIETKTKLYKTTAPSKQKVQRERRKDNIEVIEVYSA